MTDEERELVDMMKSALEGGMTSARLQYLRDYSVQTLHDGDDEEYLEDEFHCEFGGGSHNFVNGVCVRCGWDEDDGE